MFASDVDQSERSNTTTDDEFLNELASAPLETEDCLIPNHCKNELEGLEHLTKCLNQRYSSYPFVYMGTLKEALTEAISNQDIAERRPLLIYVNNDKGVSTHLFCKQLLCNEKIIDYLMNNIVFWAWDVTFDSNALKLNETFKSVFRSWPIEHGFNSEAAEKYPMLIGISRDPNGEFIFDRLIEGVQAQYKLDDFIVCLNEFKSKFENNERELERAKEEAKAQMLLKFSRASDLYRHTKHYKDRAFLRSMSSFPHSDLQRAMESHPAQFSRLLSTRHHPHHTDDYTDDYLFTHEDFIRSLQKCDVNDDNDEADDEDDDERTPTVERSEPKFN